MSLPQQHIQLKLSIQILDLFCLISHILASLTNDQINVQLLNLKMEECQIDWLSQINRAIKVMQDRQYKKAISNTQFTLSSKIHHRVRSINHPDTHYQLHATLALNKIDISNLRITKNPLVDLIGMHPFQYGYIAINVTDSGQKFILLGKDEVAQTSIYGLWAYGTSKRQDLLWNILVQYLTNFQIQKRSIFKEKTALLFLFQQKKRLPQKPQQYLFEFPENLMWTLRKSPTTNTNKSFTIKDNKNISFAQENFLEQDLGLLNSQKKQQDQNYFLPSFKQRDAALSESDENFQLKAMFKCQDRRQKIMAQPKACGRKEPAQNAQFQQEKLRCERKGCVGDEMAGGEECIGRREQDWRKCKQRLRGEINKEILDNIIQYKQKCKNSVGIDENAVLTHYSQKGPKNIIGQELSLRLSKYSSNIEDLSLKYENNQLKSRLKIAQGHVPKLPSLQNMNTYEQASSWQSDMLDNNCSIRDYQAGTSKDALDKQLQFKHYGRLTEGMQSAQHDYQLSINSLVPTITSNNQFSPIPTLTSLSQCHPSQVSTIYSKEEVRHNRMQSSDPNAVGDRAPKRQVNADKGKQQIAWSTSGEYCSRDMSCGEGCDVLKVVVDSDSDDEQLKKITNKYKRK